MTSPENSAGNGNNQVKGASLELKWLQVWRSSFTAEKGLKSGFGRWTQLLCREGIARTSIERTVGTEVLILGQGGQALAFYL